VYSRTVPDGERLLGRRRLLKRVSVCVELLVADGMKRTVVPWATNDEDILASAWGMKAIDYRRCVSLCFFLF
jgi:hypothetical protein